jgi:hypothetical protein
MLYECTLLWNVRLCIWFVCPRIRSCTALLPSWQPWHKIRSKWCRLHWCHPHKWQSASEGWTWPTSAHRWEDIFYSWMYDWPLTLPTLRLFFPMPYLPWRPPNSCQKLTFVINYESCPSAFAQCPSCPQSTKYVTWKKWNLWDEFLKCILFQLN